MMDCRRFVELLEPYLDEGLEGAEREAWREHMRNCAPCRRAALEREPTLLLALASRAGAPDERVAACVGAVRALTHGERLRRDLGRRRRAWLAAAAAAVLAVAGVLGLRGPVPGEDPAPGAGSPEARVAEPAPEVDVETRGGEVRVYRYAVDGDMAVAFVVDPSMEL